MQIYRKIDCLLKEKNLPEQQNIDAARRLWPTKQLSSLELHSTQVVWQVGTTFGRYARWEDFEVHVVWARAFVSSPIAPSFISIRRAPLGYVTQS